MKTLFRGITLIIGLIIIWQLIVWLFHFPRFILPSPSLVFLSLIHNASLIASNALITIIEALAGFLLSVIFATIAAIFILYCRPAEKWFLPILIISQALPTFAIAPLFVIWFGYGMASKIAVTLLMLFFPITSSFYDGLKNTPREFLNLAQTMNATRWACLRYIQIPAALPSFASGLRIACVYAPMGAIIGEWVGASQGLGFLMLNANSRMEISLMFASLFVVVALTLIFYFSIDRLLKRLIFWER